MSAYTVVVSDHVFENFTAEEQVLGAIGAELRVLQCRSAEELVEHMAGAHGLLNTYLPGMDARVFAAAPSLRAVVRYGIGLDTIDIAAATERGIVVANVPDYCIDEVADHALAHFMALARRLPRGDQRVRAGEWSLSYLKPMPAIRQMRLGIIGFGRIGQAIARRLAPLGAEVVFHDPVRGEPAAGAAPVTLDELYQTCDAIFVQCPSVPQTRHLLDEAAFAKMARRPLVINCARGEIVSTEALLAALEQGQISGAGLDLLEDYQTVVANDHPLKHRDDVILTPHSAWYSEAAIPSLQRRAAEEMARILQGQRPTALVNPEVWERRQP